MLLDGSQDKHLSPDEFRDLFEVLPDKEMNRLRLIAYKFSTVSRLETDDFLQEAYARTLEGRRKCPRNVDVVKHMVETMRSMLSSEAKAHKRHPEQSLTFAEDAEDKQGDLPEESPSPEDIILSEQEAGAIRLKLLGLFEDDEVALLIVEGIMEGMEGEELRALTELSKQEYGSMRRKIRRRINKAFSKG